MKPGVQIILIVGGKDMNGKMVNRTNGEWKEKNKHKNYNKVLYNLIPLLLLLLINFILAYIFYLETDLIKITFYFILPEIISMGLNTVNKNF